MHLRRLPFALDSIAATLTLAALTHACADDTPSSPLPADAIDLVQAVAAAPVAPAGSTAVRTAEGTYYAAVRTEGNGCPAGSFHTRISDDGQVFTTTFATFELIISEAQSTLSRDCRLAIDLTSPGGRSFCVQSVMYAGYANLVPGMIGRQIANYYFQDQRVPTESVREDLVGPFDDEFLFRDDVPPQEEVWTPCDQQRRLYIDTTLSLQNGQPRGSGYLNIATADGNNTLRLKVASHLCNMAQATGWTKGPFQTRADALTGTASRGSRSVERTVVQGGR